MRKFYVVRGYSQNFEVGKTVHADSAQEAVNIDERNLTHDWPLGDTRQIAPVRRVYELVEVRSTSPGGEWEATTPLNVS